MANGNFSIDVTFGAGSRNFTPEMKQAINEAADFWEDVIVGNNSGTDHNIEIEVSGENQGGPNAQGGAPLAGAAFTDTMTNSNGNVLSTAGIAIVNTNAEVFESLTSDMDLFTNVMKHEFGHVVGIGGLWEANDLIDPDRGVYKADTNAGEVYGALLNREGSEDIPLTSGVGQGSDNSHWAEEVFGNELMSHQAEGPGTSQPFSELTIASLEDIGWEVDYDLAEAFPDESTTASAFMGDFSSSNSSSALALETDSSLM
jgi:Leishmanolysin